MAVAILQKGSALDAEGHDILARADSHSNKSGELGTMYSSCQYMPPPFHAKTGKEYKLGPERIE